MKDFGIEKNKKVSVIENRNLLMKTLVIGKNGPHILRWRLNRNSCYYPPMNSSILLQRKFQLYLLYFKGITEGKQQYRSPSRSPSGFWMCIANILHVLPDKLRSMVYFMSRKNCNTR